MLRYSTSTVEDYIVGNDIEDFDIDELENDRNFMLDVIKKTNDKNFYNLCSDDLKHDYMFVSMLLDIFKCDKKFIINVAEEFVKYYRSKNILPTINEEDEKNLFDILITMIELIPDKSDKIVLKYKVILNAMINTKMIAIENVKNKLKHDYTISKNIGCGFIFIFDSFNSSTKVTDRFACEYISNIFSKDNCNLEEYLHARFACEESVKKYGINTILIEIINHFDCMLGSYVSTHLYLLDEYKKDVKHIFYKWNSFYDRKNIKICGKICSAIQDYLEYYYPESEIDPTSWLYYIAEKLGITNMFLKFDGLKKEFVEGIIEEMDEIYFSDMKLSELKHLVNMKKIISDILAGKDAVINYPDIEDDNAQKQITSCEIISLNFKKND